MHLRARYYQPEVGRFFQVDPWPGYDNLPATFNPYTYALANPIRHSDPCGKDPISNCIGLILVLAPVDPFTPFGEAVGVIGCGIILLAAGWSMVHASLHAQEAGQALSDVLEDVIDVCNPIEWMYHLPEAESVLEPSPEPKPEPVGPDIFPIPRVEETPRPNEPNWVVRGGISAPETLRQTYDPIPSMPGHFGFSIQYQPGRTVDELAAAGQFRYGQISYATDIDLLSAAAALGYYLTFHPTPRDGPGFHHDLEVSDIAYASIVRDLPPDLANALSTTFRRKPNPFRVP